MNVKSQNPSQGYAGTTYDRALSMLANGKHFQAEALVGCAIVDAIDRLTDAVLVGTRGSAATGLEELPPGWTRRTLDD
jgi:hypothetical protein